MPAGVVQPRLPSHTRRRRRDIPTILSTLLFSSKPGMPAPPVRRVAWGEVLRAMDGRPLNLCAVPLLRQCTGADWFNRIVVGAAFNPKNWALGPLALPWKQLPESRPSSLTAKPATAQTAEAAELGVRIDSFGPQLRTRMSYWLGLELSKLQDEETAREASDVASLFAQRHVSSHHVGQPKGRQGRCACRSNGCKGTETEGKAGSQRELKAALQWEKARCATAPSDSPLAFL